MPYGCEELCKKTVSEILEGSGWNDARGYIRPHAFERRRDSKDTAIRNRGFRRTGGPRNERIVFQADLDAARVINASTSELTLWQLYAAFALNFPLQQEQRGSLFIHSAPNAWRGNGPFADHLPLHSGHLLRKRRRGTNPFPSKRASRTKRQFGFSQTR
jgi:hypothetical protein